MTNGWSEFAGFFKEYFPVPESFMDSVLRSHPHDELRIKRLQSREDQLAELLSSDNKLNMIDDLYNIQYQELIHKKFKPYVIAYGKEMKEKILNKNKGKGSKKFSSDSSNYSSLQMLHMFESGENTCISHALGAEL